MQVSRCSRNKRITSAIKASMVNRSRFKAIYHREEYIAFNKEKKISITSCEHTSRTTSGTCVKLQYFNTLSAKSQAETDAIDSADHSRECV